jgi:hypothetical protein
MASTTVPRRVASGDILGSRPKLKDFFREADEHEGFDLSRVF